MRINALTAPIGPPEHDRSLRAVVMALHAIIVRSPAKSGPRAVIELEVDGTPVEVVLGEKPSVRVAPVSSADARLRTRLQVLADYLNGEGLAEAELKLHAGDAEVHARVLEALAAMA